MIKMILAFIFFFLVFFFGILAVREMTGRQRWVLTKLIAYSIICAVLTTVALIGFVLVF